MDLRHRSDNLSILTFPADDAVFRERVVELVDRLRKVGREASFEADLEAGLRRVHPQVDARWRSGLAGFGDRALYVFRDGTVVARLERDDWTAAEATARVVTDATGLYVDANEAAADLFGVPRERILSARAGAFTELDARIENPDALWRALGSTGRLHSLAVVCRPDGSTRSVEFITVRDGDGPDRHVTYLRAVE